MLRRVRVQNCPNMASLNASCAFQLECISSDITELLAWEAITLIVSNNKKLASLFMPKVQKAHLDLNPALKTIDAPEALTLHFLVGCATLESIFAPQAVVVVLGANNSRLTSLTVAEGANIRVSGFSPLPASCNITYIPQIISQEFVKRSLLSLLADEPFANIIAPLSK